MTTTLYAIRDAAGALHALHERRDGPDGKAMSWRAPDGSYGLRGRRVESLPLYGAQNIAAWPSAAWIIVTEGESDCDALTALDVPALGTVTGATVKADGSHTAPSADALADVAGGRRFVTWPDNDAVGRGHMAAAGANLYRAGAAAVRTILYTPSAVPWAKGAGARDLIGGAEPATGAMVVGWALEEWSLPVDRPGPVIAIGPPAVRGLWDPGSVSAALITRGIVEAKPGKTVRCLAHHDEHASLSILADDKRAVCKAASCEWSGRGVIAADVLAMVSA